MSIREQIEYALVKAIMTNQEISQALNVPITVINSIETDLGLHNDI
jgi:DNA-binding CsgD family transcriptional regulator